MALVLTLAVVLVLFGLTIFVHEIGHFLAARRCGMLVETFSIGFGPALWKRKIRGVDWKVGALPFGGYVALPQMDVGADEAAAGETAARPPPAPPASRAVVAVAGAAFNLLFAFVIAVVIYVAVGHEAVSPRAPVIGFIETNSAAYAVGLRLGDRVMSVNGSRVQTWDDVVVNATLGAEARLRVQGSDGMERDVIVPTEEGAGGARFINGVDKQVPCLIIGVLPSSPAERAGLQRRDLILRLGGEPVLSVDQFIEATQRYRDTDVAVVVNRGGQTLELVVRPQWNERFRRVMMGVEINRFDLSMTPGRQMVAWGAPVFRILKAFGTRGERGYAARSVGGPVYIFRMYWMAAQTSLLLALWVTGMLNVNLAILNLLPIPVLDGGHVVMAAIEGAIRRPLPPRVFAWLHRAFALLLIALFVMITLRDIYRLFGPRGGETAAAPDETPAAAPAR